MCDDWCSPPTPMDYHRVTMTDRGGLGELQHSACVASAR